MLYVVYVCLGVWGTCMNFMENVNVVEAAFWLGVPHSAYNILWVQPTLCIVYSWIFFSYGLQSTERFYAKKSNGHIFFSMNLW